jgi:hypothetical protein
VTAFVLVLAGVAAFVFRVVRLSDEAERRLHATILVCRLARTYVEENHTWPTAWSDLERLEPLEYAMYRWPEDREKIARQVTIRFGVSLESLCRAEDAFDAVEPNGPAFAAYDQEVLELIEAAKNALSLRERQPPSSVIRKTR